MPGEVVVIVGENWASELKGDETSNSPTRYITDRTYIILAQAQSRGCAMGDKRLRTGHLQDLRSDDLSQERPACLEKGRSRHALQRLRKRAGKATESEGAGLGK